MTTKPTGSGAFPPDTLSLLEDVKQMCYNRGRVDAHQHFMALLDSEEMKKAVMLNIDKLDNTIYTCRMIEVIAQYAISTIKERVRG